MRMLTLAVMAASLLSVTVASAAPRHHAAAHHNGPVSSSFDAGNTSGGN